MSNPLKQQLSAYLDTTFGASSASKKFVLGLDTAQEDDAFNRARVLCLSLLMSAATNNTQALKNLHNYCLQNPNKQFAKELSALLPETERCLKLISSPQARYVRKGK